MMPKLLQINATANWGSTGKIAEQINDLAQVSGWECYFAYGRNYNSSNSTLLRVGNMSNVYWHYLENRILDNEGLASRKPTEKLIQTIKEIKPDVIHLHNIHDHWINYDILFQYLNSTDIPIIWTFHDFWAITGHCSHFIHSNCYKWQSECNKCPISDSLIDRSRRNFKLKKRLFSQNTHIHIITVSEWVSDLVKRSFLGNKDIRVIPNGIDLNIFRYRRTIQNKYLFDNKFIIMAVASQWKSGKGFKDYIKLSKLLRNDEIIVLVGINEQMRRELPSNIIGITRTNNPEELAELYSIADVVTSFSSAETFGLTVIEAYACGTPVVVYNNSVHPYIVNDNTGYSVPDGDYEAAYHAIQAIRIKGKEQYSQACIQFATYKFNKDIVYKQYVDLYKEVLNK